MNIPRKKNWLERFEEAVELHLSDVKLTNRQLAKELELSEGHLIRRIKQQTGKTPRKYIREYRLLRAKKYLEEGTYRTVKQTAYAVGFVKADYFIKKYEASFGIKPYQVLKNNGWR